MGILIDPSEIKTQAQSIVTALTEQTNALTAVLPHIECFEQSSSLQSEAWESLKSKMGGHRTLITSLTSTHKSVTQDSQTLINTVGEEKLDEDQINEELDRLKGENQRKRLSINSYQRGEAYNLSLSLTQSYYQMQITNLEIGIQLNENAIVLLNEKLTKIQDITAATDDLYGSAAAYYLLIQQGINNLMTGWTSAGQPLGVSGSWQQTLNEPKEVEAMGSLLKEGFTEKDFEFMKSVGYSMVEMIDIWKSLKDNKKDQEFFKFLVKRDYDKAFYINPDELSDDLKYILTNHMAKLTTMTDDQGNLAELTTVMNVLLFDGEGGRGETYLLTMASLSEVMAIQSATLMSELDPESDSYQQTSKLFDKYTTLYNLSMGIAALETPQRTMVGSVASFRDWYGISQLKVNKNKMIEFNLNYFFLDLTQSKATGDNIAKQMRDEVYPSLKGKSTISRHGTASGAIVDSSSELTKLLKKKDKLQKDLVIDIFGETVGIFNPVFKLEVDILKNLDEKKYNEVGKDLIGKAAKLSSKTTFIGNLANIGNLIFKYQRDIDSLEKELDGEKKSLYNKLINIGSTSNSYTGANGSNETYGFPGIPDVKAIKARKELDENGIKNMLTKNQQDNLRQQYGGNSKLTESEKYLLGESSKTLTELDPNEFANAFLTLHLEDDPSFDSDKVLQWLAEGSYN